MNKKQRLCKVYLFRMLFKALLNIFSGAVIRHLRPAGHVCAAVKMRVGRLRSVCMNSIANCLHMQFIQFPTLYLNSYNKLYKAIWLRTMKASTTRISQIC